MGTEIFIVVSVLPLELLAYQVSMISARKFIYLMQYWAECMTLSVFSIAHFTLFLNLNNLYLELHVNADICK